MKKIISACILSVFLCASSALAAPRFTIGLLQLVEHPSLDEIRTAIIDELNVMGYADTIAVDYQNGQNSPSLISTICQKFIGQGVDLILPIATPAAQGAAAATSDIPIVFAAVSDPVAAGLVKDLNAPEANVTGVSDAIHPSKVLDLAAELTPGIKHWGIVYNTAEASSTSTVRRAEAEMTRRGMTFTETAVSTAAEVIPAVTSLAGKVEALYIPDDNTVALAMTVLSEIALEHGKPVYAAVDSLVRDGGLATAGINYTNLGRQTARMAVKVLEGTPVSKLPVEVLRETSVVVNPDTAAALGVDVSKYVKK
ncbi:MAG: ABC transporter substrate-binding protein [Pyramidobacter sp.]|nr:ABC transporter substrate-binding protein [Pyramidobacter sp.]